MRSRIRWVGLTALTVAAGGWGRSLEAQSPTLASLTAKTGLSVQRYEIDWPHSMIEFTVPFMGLSHVRGSFAQFGGTIMYDSTDITRSSVSVVIEVGSIDTHVKFRDDHLRSPDFFDAKQYPLMSFRSSTITRTAQGLLLQGALTMHGVTQQIAIPVTQLHGSELDAWGNRRIGFSGRTTLSRKAFGIKGTAFWNSEFDPGRFAVGDEATIELTIEGRVSNVEKWTNPVSDSLIAAAEQDGWDRALARFRERFSDSTTAAARGGLDALATAASKLIQRGKLDAAIRVCQVLDEMRPGTAMVQAGMAEVLLMQGKREAAVARFRKALEADSTNSVAAEYLRHLGARP